MKALKAIIAAIMMCSPIAAEFDVGADVVSRYVWRGSLADDNVAVQPSLSYTAGDLELGAWSAWAIASSGNNESDLYVTYTGLPVAVTLTDYYFPGEGSDFFEFGDAAGVHQLEVSGAFEAGAIGIAAAVIVSGEPDNPLYLEGSYHLPAGADLVAAVGTESYTTTGDPALIWVGLSASRDAYTATYIVNPDAEQSWLVISLELD